MSESWLSHDIRFELGSRSDTRLFRNTRGVVLDGRSGNWITYGLATGASDLIGFRSVVITPQLVGSSLPVFTAIEAKVRGARTKKELLEQQTSFINMVRSFGGFAGFATSVEEARRIVLL